MEGEAPLDVAGRVAAAAAHDFNNHLAAISLQAELALAAAPPGDEKLRRRLRGILGSCDNARELARSLLAFGGRRPLRPSPVDLAEIIEALPGGEVQDRPLVVDLDRDALDDALTLLRAFASAVSVRGDGDEVELRATLPGEEADDGAKRRLFEPFAAEGDRLGLAAVYGFIRQSRGSIELVPAPGGAAIVVRLPRAAT